MKRLSKPKQRPPDEDLEAIIREDPEAAAAFEKALFSEIQSGAYGYLPDDMTSEELEKILIRKTEGKSQKEEESITLSFCEEIRATLKKIGRINPATSKKQAIPEPEKEKPLPACKAARGFLRGNCMKCRRLSGERLEECRQYVQRFVKIPHVIQDTYMSDMTGDEWKILTYVARCANFDPRSRNFGKAFLKYADITTATGVKRPDRALRRLEELGLIKKVHIRQKSSEGITTLNTIIVRWIKPTSKF
jgi:hypothetical protein